MHSYQPSRLRPVQDAAALEQLRNRGPLWKEVDLLPGQLDELVDCRLAGRDDPPRRDAIRQDLTNGQPLDELGVWVHYPWSGVLVRVLPQDQFHELRFDRNRDKLTREEQTRLRRARIGVVGLSVGNAVALTLAQEGIAGHIVLCDFDELSTSNLNRIRAAIHAVGLPKTVVAARQIAEVDPFVDVTLFSEGLTFDNLDEVLAHLDILVDECDDIAMKVALRHAARARRIPVLMETSDRGRLDVERYDEDPAVPLLNGRFAPDLDPRAIQRMNAGERLALVAESVGYEITTRAAASLLEIGATLSTWPQLASDVALGGATVAAAARRILLGRPLPSGLRIVDLDARLDDIEAPAPDPSPVAPPAQRTRPPLSALQRSLIEAATLAPSGGNAQPWAFRPLPDDGVEVLHDAARSRSHLDPEGVSGLLAVGAAIEGMALRASELGMQLEVRPTGAVAGAVARVRVGPRSAPTADPLAAQLGHRFTDRRNPEPVPLSVTARAALSEPFDATTRLFLLEDREAMDTVGRLIGELDRLRYLHPDLQREMWQEVRWSDAEAAQRSDGISLAEMAVGAGDVPILRLLRRPDVAADLRERDRGSRLADLALVWSRSASALGMVTTAGRRPEDWIVAGRAIHRMWLAACGEGLAVQPMSASVYMIRNAAAGGYRPAELATLQAADRGYADAFGIPGEAMPALLFRVLQGGPRYAATHRRPLNEVVQG